MSDAAPSLSCTRIARRTLSQNDGKALVSTNGSGNGKARHPISAEMRGLARRFRQRIIEEEEEHQPCS